MRRSYETQRSQRQWRRDCRGAQGPDDGPLRIDIGVQVITASITNEAVDEMKLANGQKAHAVIKASDVMIATD
jgi:molybdopterin-binding protein